MKSPSKGLRRRFMENQLITTQYRTSYKKSNQEKEQNLIHWITYFRRNWHIYVDFILGICYNKTKGGILCQVILWI